MSDASKIRGMREHVVTCGEQFGCFITTLDGRLIAKGISRKSEDHAKDTARRNVKLRRTPVIKTIDDEGIVLACKVWCTDRWPEVRNVTQRARNVPAAVRLLNEAWERMFNANPTLINYGSCNDFADDIVACVPAAIIRWDDPETPRHSFVEWHGKLYDAESPDGVGHYEDLPFFNR